MWNSLMRLVYKKSRAIARLKALLVLCFRISQNTRG